MRLWWIAGDGLQLLIIHSVRDADTKYLDASVFCRICFLHSQLSLHVRFTIGYHDY